MLKRAIGPTIQLELDVPEEDLCIRVDGNQLELALFNLAANARDGCYRPKHCAFSGSPLGCAFCPSMRAN